MKYFHYNASESCSQTPIKFRFVSQHRDTSVPLPQDASLPENTCAFVKTRKNTSSAEKDEARSGSYTAASLSRPGDAILRGI